MSSTQTVIMPTAARAETPILALLTTVFTSILEVFLLCLAGYILAGRGILDKKTQKQLNHLNVSLFTPSLLFSKVAFFLSPEKLKELWIIPIWFILVTSVSMSVSFILGWVFRVKRSQRNFAMAAAMFMNSNSLPIALMQSLVVTVPGLKWGKDDNKNAMVGRALTYLVLYSTLGMVLRWSYGVKLLAQSDPENEPVAAGDADEETSALLDHQFAADEGTLRPSSETSDDAIPAIQVEADPHRTTLHPPHRRRHSRFYNSFPNSPNQSRMNLADIDSAPVSTVTSTFVVPSPDSSDSESDSETGAAHGPEAPPLPQHVRRPSQRQRQRSTRQQAPPTWARRTRRRAYRAWVALNEFMTVPLWAALASLIVACARPLQHALEAHMQPVKGALTSAGNCSIPLTLIVLGAYFYPAPPPDGALPSVDARRVHTVKSSSSLIHSVRQMFGKPASQRVQAAQETEAPARPGETKTVIIAVASRMILTPLLLLPLMVLSTKFDLHAVFDDPVFVVSNVLLVSSPPALTLAQITQAASGDAFERLISRTIFWAYCIVTPPATIAYVVIGLVLSKL
ncbi:membrane transport protein-domain-containing protein [Mycena sp. CBHHK59/15]|nr:membrane transport protein-domain-containing protein [Mycena sp. CBHHK59/15]